MLFRRLISYLVTTVFLIFIGNYFSNLFFNNRSFEELKVPSEWNDDGIFSIYYDDAFKKLSQMTLEEKIGQVLLVRLPSTDVEKAIKKYKIGGFVFYKKDIDHHSKNSLTNLIKSYNKEAPIPLLIAVDEEGGSVVRLSCNKNMRQASFKSPQNIFKEAGYEGIRNNTREMCELLGDIGFNVNLAPVADVSTNPENYIYRRSFGKSANETAEFIKNVIETSKGTKLSFVIKHFPGLGGNNDTHKGTVIDERDIDELKSVDLIPFMRGIEVGAESIMVSHNVVNCLDEKMPASLSKKVNNFARSSMNFKGVIMTDNVDMMAVRKFTNSTGVVEAMLAGNDIIMVTDYKQCIKEIKQALKNKVLTENVIDYMAFKVLAWKYYKGLIF